MTYPPLSQARDTLNVQWYRSPMPQEVFRGLSQRSDLKGWKQAGGHSALFAGTGSFVWLFWAQEQWAAFALALFLHGTVGSFFSGTAPHELGHGTVFRTKVLNKIFLYIFSLLSWWNPFDYAASHTYHHRFTLHPEGDRENLLPLHPNTDKLFLLQLFTINIMTQPGRTFGKGGLISTLRETVLHAFGRVGSTDISSNEWLDSLHKDQPDQHRRAIQWSRLLLVFHGGVFVLAWVTGLWILPIVLSLFNFIGNWLGYFLGLPQHCGLRENVPDFRKTVRSMRLHPILEFLYWHMNWHTEHHMYAGVPCYNLKQLHHAVKDDMPKPRSLLGAWREMLEIWERQKREPSYQFDTPLPVTAQTRRKRAAVAEEASIGDLAPEALR